MYPILAFLFVCGGEFEHRAQHGQGKDEFPLVIEKPKREARVRELEKQKRLTGLQYISSPQSAASIPGGACPRTSTAESTALQMNWLISERNDGCVIRASDGSRTNLVIN
jgi:hypothetical protein